MTGTWVVIADSSRARIFDVEKATGPLREIESLVHPEARMHETALTSDMPGRKFNSAAPVRQGLSQTVSVKEAHAIKFARQLGSHLETARAKGHFDRLVLAAPPTFLGILRTHLTPATTAAVSTELNKDLTLHTPAQIRKHLPTRI